MSGIVIVGAGQAGVAMAGKLRALGYDGRLTMVGAEPVPPYQRPPLSKAYLLGDLAAERLQLRPDSFYRQNEIDLRLGVEMTELDPRQRILRIGAENFSYDQLALTTGATAHGLHPSKGGMLEGVHTLRTVADAAAVMRELRPGRRVLVMGGGYLGLEVAATAAKCGLIVTLVEMADRILGRVAASETSDFFRNLHRSNGVRILEGISLEKLEGDRRVSRAVLSDGSTCDADLVIVGIGVVPNTALARTAGLSIDDGIALDAFCRTSAEGIWAAGDCASFPYRETRLRLESVQNAIEQAETVAANMLGSRRAYEPVPWFWSDQFDVKLQIAGINRGYARVISRAPAGGKRSYWYFGSDDRLLAVDAVNDPACFMVAKRLLAANHPVDPAELMNSLFDPRSLLKGL